MLRLEDGARTGGGRGQRTGSAARVVVVVVGLCLEVSQGQLGLALELVPVKIYNDRFSIITMNSFSV